MGLCKQYEPVSRYFKESDIPAGKLDVVLTIKSVGEATFDDGRSQPTIEFDEHEKILGLNQTNRNKLAELFGQDDGTGNLDFEAQDIIGQQISIYRTKTKDKSGATVPCVRIRAVQRAAQPPTQGRPNVNRQQAGPASGSQRGNASASPARNTQQRRQPAPPPPQDEPGSNDGPMDSDGQPTENIPF